MKHNKLLTFLMIIAAVLFAIVLAMRDTLIIHLGIVSYRTLLTAAGLIFGVLLLLTVITAAAAGSRKSKERREQKKAQQQLEEQQRRAKELEAGQEAGLSVRKKLDPEAIRAMLEKEKNSRWAILEDEISACIVQMEKMNDYQAKLAGLLRLNDARSLQDTEDVLDQVEQYLCRNVRKALNYMNILDPASPEDAAAARKKLLACHDDNQQRLSQTQEFLVALTDFLNRQGDGNAEIDMLEIYRKTILDSIQE